MRLLSRSLRTIRKHRWKVVAGAIVLGLIPIAVDQAIGRSVSVHTETSTLPLHDVALVLGTAPTVAGRANLYYEYRLDAAAKLQEGSAEEFS
ncbi:MAG: hypothetical protein AAF368_12735 [Planctomycetota bacterium]